MPKPEEPGPVTDIDISLLSMRNMAVKLVQEGAVLDDQQKTIVGNQWWMTYAICRRLEALQESQRGWFSKLFK